MKNTNKQIWDYIDNDGNTKKKKQCEHCGSPIEPQYHNGKVFWTDGHDGFPVCDGRVCDDCNSNAVIPARLRTIQS
jgi:methionyl-tRNA synthetase|tara:strand:- start:341 stop:568 length:228 start_codon:yes stop_codon:yes gene_type:complete